MNRTEQLRRYVAPFAQNEPVTLKFVSHLEELLDFVSPDAIGEVYRRALSDSKYDKALEALAEHYRKKADFSAAELSAEGEYDASLVRKYKEGVVRVVNIDWDFSKSGFDYLFDPTIVHGPRNHEWLWQHSRHYDWIHIARAYVQTADEEYAEVFSDRLLRWIGQTEVPENWNGPGSAWRTIECGIRLRGSWQVAFDGFKRSPAVSDAVLLLMIASMHRQAVHLADHPTQRNWLMLESNGLYTFSALFPEFCDAEKNRRLATERLLSELEGQILPDGMQNELSPDYQYVVLSCVSNFYQLADTLGYKSEIPESFVSLMHRTARAAILLSTPALTQPSTNDTFTVKTRRFTEKTAELLGDTPEYRFINTERKEGLPPCGETASAFFPYAGFAVMRSDWSADAAYLCFDVGPLGTAHVHQDMLNIIMFKGERELIYDDGGGQYEISDARRYALSSYAHNLVLVDGMPQTRKTPSISEKPIDAGWVSTSEFDYATATYADTYGEEGKCPATHKREVRFIKPNIFCVVDTMTATDDACHDYELLFHMDTTSVLPLDGYQNGVCSAFGDGYEVAILAVDDDPSSVTLEIASAVTEPLMQGWYNGRNDRNLHAASTVSRKACQKKEHRFVSFLVPFKKGESLPEIKREGEGRISLTLGAREHTLDLFALGR